MLRLIAAFPGLPSPANVAPTIAVRCFKEATVMRSELTRRQLVQEIQRARRIPALRPLQRSIGPGLGALLVRFYMGHATSLLHRSLGDRAADDHGYATWVREIEMFDEIFLPVAAGPMRWACLLLALLAGVIGRPFVTTRKLRKARSSITLDQRITPRLQTSKARAGQRAGASPKAGHGAPA